MERYKNGKIYSIRSPSCEEYYIGSTCMPLAKRFYNHKKDFERYIEGKRGLTTSFYIIQFGDAYIELIEEYPCENKNQLERREGEIMRERKDEIVNRLIAGRTPLEYYNDNKERIKEHKRQYHEGRKDKVIEYRKNYEEVNKEQIKERKRLYYLANREQKLQKYQENKDLINQKRRERKQAKKSAVNIDADIQIGESNSKGQEV